MQYLGAPQTDLRIEIHDEDASVASKSTSPEDQACRDPRVTNVQSYAHQRFDVEHEAVGRRSTPSLVIIPVPPWLLSMARPPVARDRVVHVERPGTEVAVGDDLRFQDATESALAGQWVYQMSQPVGTLPKYTAALRSLLHGGASLLMSVPVWIQVILPPSIDTCHRRSATHDRLCRPDTGICHRWFALAS